jgi:hypothetical protein
MIASEHRIFNAEKSIRSHVRIAANIKLVQIVNLSYHILWYVPSHINTNLSVVVIP